MPELPEVESVKNGLNNLIIDEKILSVDVLWDNIIKQPDPETFTEYLVGESFETIRRRGKYLLLDLTNFTLVSHLRMEGKYRLVDTKDDLNKHDHVIFHLSSGKDLRYNDVRKFGTMVLVDKYQEDIVKGIQKLGPEPVADELDIEALKTKLQRHSKSIKAVLLDQTAVAGLGNIYCDEVLYLAKIHPAKPSKQLTDEEISGLRLAIIEVMAQAVEAGGTTIRTYKNAFGEDGHFQNALNVYGKEGEICKRCGHTIEKATIAQRGTHYCPHCQII